MSRQFGTNDGTGQFTEITAMWDGILKQPQGENTVQILVNGTIGRCVAQINDALARIKYSKENPSAIRDINKIIAEQNDKINTSLVALKHFVEYAKNRDLTHEYQDEYNNIIGKPKDADNHQPSSPTKPF